MEGDFNDVNDMSFIIEGDDDIVRNLDDDHNQPIPVNNQPSVQPQPDQLSQSQDQDFQSQVGVVLRPRNEASHMNIPQPRSQDIDAEVNISTEHNTFLAGCKIQSAHISFSFLISCILKWIAQENRKNNIAKCPECNYPAKRKDLRRIWSKSITTLDTAERDETNARAKREHDMRIQCEQELAQSRMAYEMLKIEMNKLQKKHDRQRSLKMRYRAELNQLKPTQVEKDIAKRSAYAFRNVLVLRTMPSGIPFYMSYRPDEEMLACSRFMNGVHGLAKISMRDFSSSLHDIIPIHSQPIRDVQCYTSDPTQNKSLILTTSQDKTLKVTSALSKQTVLSYDLKAPGWSCCWSTLDSNIMYCSVQAKEKVLSFDIRNTKGPVASFAPTNHHSPIHSMIHIGPTETRKREGILCGNYAGPFVYTFESSTKTDTFSQGSVVGVSANEGSIAGEETASNEGRQEQDRSKWPTCSSVSYNPITRHWMASYKFIEKPFFTQHVRGVLDYDESSGELGLKKEFKVAGGAPVPCMSRTTVFSRKDGSIHMAAGSIGKSYIWCSDSKLETSNVFDVSLSQLSSGDDSVKRIILEPEKRHAFGHQAQDPIKDIKSVFVGDKEYVTTLSDRQIVFYEWSETQKVNELDLEEFDDSDEDQDIEEIESEREKGKRRRIEVRSMSDQSNIGYIGSQSSGDLDYATED
ncbi:RING finger and WD repeat domain-containing protein 3 [Lobosporangium transversale]|nr:RING finger and WD repeat domain-containing protein 3 [Lobosporangium transversale]